MASGVEKLIGGGKKENYVSSSDSDQDDLAHRVSPPKTDGLPQTGPKGVLTDYYRMQQEERRKEMLAEKRRKELIEKHTATVKSQQETGNSSDSAAIVNLARALNDGSLAQDPFMQEYRAKRLGEIKEQAKLGAQRVLFGHLLELRGDKYASSIDSAPPQTFIVIHIYDELMIPCQLMNKCLSKMAKVYPTVKFCRVQSHQVGVSHDFVQNALPAILVYRGGDLIGNHLRITDTLGHEFTDGDVEGFLQDKGCLPPESEKGDLLSPDPCEDKIFGRRKKLESDSD